LTSHDYDRSKLRAYSSAGVREVWLVLVPERQVEVYRQPDGSRYAERDLVGPDENVSSALLPNFELNLAAFFKG
jgi:Uma2 family endonuclease